MNRAIVLLSGGLDSVVALASVIKNYEETASLTFDYSQKSAVQEIKASKDISAFYGIDNKVIKLDWLGDISNSALNNSDEIPELNEKDITNAQLMNNSAKSVWVPNRNALFITIAGCFAEAKGYNDIIIGANKEEAETFTDNTIEFLNSINKTFRYSVNAKIRAYSPLINMTKSDIVKKGIELNIPFNLIYSCYNSREKHCGKCESCIRLKNALKNYSRTDIINNIFM